MLRIIRECTPRYVVGENVRGLVSWNGGLVFEEVCADLEAFGYAVQPFLLPAASVNAPHKRQRVWYIAKDANADGRSCDKWQGESCQRRQRDISARDHEQLHADHDEVISPWASTHPERSGQQRQGKHEQRVQSASIREGQTDRADRCHEDTGGKHARPNFESFPTQPPVCGGDDGIPRELDSVTFSKWRKESIKAYGNAIVPQVAYQIFKAIEQYERLDR